jgi:hypothetical protein
MHVGTARDARRSTRFQGGTPPKLPECTSGSTGLTGIFSLLLEADCTRWTQDVRRPWTKRSGNWQNRMEMRFALSNASRAAAWRRRRIAVARSMQIALCTNLPF